MLYCKHKQHERMMFMKKFIKILLLCLFAYMIGHSHGQASAYLKMHDDKTVEAIYSKGGK